MRRLLPVFLASLAAAPLPLLGGETGAIGGLVRDRSGSPLAGIPVTAKGDPAPGGRQAVSDAAGRFRLPSLPPGTYAVTALVAGMAPAELQVVVAVDRETQITLVLAPAVSQEVEVQAIALPLVDVKTTEVGRSFTRDAFERLPIGRTYKELLQLNPTSFDNPSRSGVNAGGFREDNIFLADGVNITSPFYADRPFNFISELDVQELAIKRGAVTAEFGRTGGFITNAVTKSGSNDLHGEARLEWQPKNASSRYDNGTLGSTRDRVLPAGGVGGPILKDVVWFYGSGAYTDDTEANRTNLFNVRPSTSDPATSLPDQTSRTTELFGKVTAAPTQALSLNGSYRYKKIDRENDGIGATSAPTVGYTSFNKTLLLNAGGTWFVSSQAFAELKYNRVREDDGLTPNQALLYQPSFDPLRPDRMGQFLSTPNLLVGGTQVPGQLVGVSSLAKNDDNFRRDEVRGSFTAYGAWLGAEHELKAGFGWDENGETLDRVSNGWGDVRYSTSANTCLLGGSLPAGKTPCFTAAYVGLQPRQESTGRVLSLYVQDRVTFGSRVTATVGLLANRDEYIAGIPATGGSYDVLTFGFGDQLQPRVGVSVVVDPRAADKAYANYGRYYNSDNKALARNASRYRIYSTNARFDANGVFLGEIPNAAEVDKVVLPDIRPQYTDEVIVGYSRPLFGKVSVDLSGQYRSVRDFFDDFPTVDVNTSNPKSFVYGNIDGARRRYRAATIEVTRAYADGWYASAAYTLSRLEGNWDLDAFGDARNYNSSSLQDGPGYYASDLNRDGILTGDRTHILKVFASYRVKGVNVGAAYRLQSGLPYEARGFGDYAGSNLYLEPAGSRRTPTWSNLDLLLAYELPVAGLFTVRLEGRVFNVLNTQTALTVDNRKFLAGGVPNPAFEEATSFAPPRRLALTAAVTF